MTVTWVLESNVFAEVCFDQMVAHLKARDLPHEIVRIIPFVHEIDGKKPVLANPVVAYGSIGVQKLAAREGWTPGVFTDPETFNYETYRNALGGMIVNDDAVKMRLSEAADYIFEQGHDRDYFIKPNGDTKEFAGTVLPGYEFVPWFKKMLDIGYLEETDFDIVIASPKKLGCEWRVVVVDGKISDSSIYRQYGIVKPERHIIPEVEAVVYEAHKRFVPAPVYVIDIAQVRYGDEWAYKVIEYNTFNSAGLYACDVAKIIDDITAYVERVHV